MVMTMWLGFCVPAHIRSINWKLRYKHGAFLEDLKKLYELTGVKNQKMTFLFSDSWNGLLTFADYTMECNLSVHFNSRQQGLGLVAKMFNS